MKKKASRPEALKHKRFVYEIAVNAIPHNKETAKIVFGGGYNPDFPEHTHANELIWTVLQDAVIANLTSITKHLAKCKCDVKDMTESDQRQYFYLKKKSAVSKFVQESLKFVRAEEANPNDKEYYVDDVDDE